MKTHKIIFLSLVLIFMAACSTNPPPKPAALVNFTPKMAPKALWSTRVGSGAAAEYLKFTPAFANGNVFIAAGNGMIKAVNEQSGKKIWQINTKVALSTGVAANNNMLFVGAKNGQVLALQQKDGHLAWHVNLPSEILSAPAATDDKVIVKTSNGQLTAFATKNGAKIWSYTNPTPALILRSSSAPKIAGNLVISGFADGELVALDLNSGNVIWKQQIATPQGNSAIDRMIDIDADPVIFGNVIYAAAFQGNVAAVRIKTGKIFWQHNISCYAGLSVTEKYVYVTDAQNSIWALMRNTGKVIWQQHALLNRGVSAPVAIGNTVAVGDMEGYLHFMDAKNGNFVARVQMDNSGIATQPVVRGNNLYIITRKGNITKFTL